MQDDGNLTRFRVADYSFVWTSKTAGKGSGPWTVYCQPDGNICLYDANMTALWCSYTAYSKNGFQPKDTVFIVQNDANLVVYGGDGKVKDKASF